MISSKAQMYSTNLIFSLLLTGLLATSLIFILPGQVTKISHELEKQEFENKAILMANALMSHPSLISSNRGIFSSEKLNQNMFEISESFDTISVCKPDLCTFYSYPNSFAIALVKDVENNKEWFSFVWPKFSDEFLNKILSCFVRTTTNPKTQIQELFDNTEQAPKILKLEECGFKRSTTVLSADGFPIAIRYCPPDNPHEFEGKCYKVETCENDEKCDLLQGCVSDPGNTNHEICWYEPVTADTNLGWIKVLVVE